MTFIPGKNKSKCGFVVCTLIDIGYASLLFSQTMFSYCFCMLSAWVCRCFWKESWRVQVAHLHNAVRALSSRSRCNLVPRCLVGEAEGEIWQRNCFSWLAAPFDSCPIPSLTIDAVFRGKLSSNSSSNLEISTVGENEKTMRKVERRNDLEVICHSGLNNFCNMTYRYLNPKHVIQRALKLPSISHTCFFDTKLYKPLPMFAFLFALTRSPNLRTKTACREQIPEAF